MIVLEDAPLEWAIDGAVAWGSRRRAMVAGLSPPGSRSASSAAISAFNHPLNLIVHQVAPAVAVGCRVIVKPAAPTPLSCLELVALLREAGLPEPWCQTFVTEDNALSERLVTDPRIAFLSFIGSARVGWYLRSKLAPRGRVARLSMGVRHRSSSTAAPSSTGSSSLSSRVATITLARSATRHSESSSTAISRPNSSSGWRRAGACASGGDPLLADTEVGPLILPREATRVGSWIDEAVAGGAQLIGGGRRSETTLMPTILLEPAADAKVSQLEIFGPATCVYGFETLDDAVEIANSLPFAFQASVFSTDIGPALRAAQRLDASAVMINDHTAFRVCRSPDAVNLRTASAVSVRQWTRCPKRRCSFSGTLTERVVRAWHSVGESAPKWAPARVSHKSLGILARKVGGIVRSIAPISGRRPWWRAALRDHNRSGSRPSSRRHA